MICTLGSQNTNSILCCYDLTFTYRLFFNYRVNVDMFGWYGNSDLRDNNGELSSHILPPPVEYVTFDEYLLQHNRIIQHSDIINLTFNVTLVIPSIMPTTVPPALPQPVCINDTIFYVVISILAAFSFIFLAALIATLCCRNYRKQPQ